jgi:hypothetical protein
VGEAARLDADDFGPLSFFNAYNDSSEEIANPARPAGFGAR